MRLIERAGLAVLHRFDPETAHGLALRGLNAGLAPTPGIVTSPRLRTRLCGLDLPNPVGLAAGFDKNAVAVNALSRTGFGFLETGAATPRPQPGNPRPRLFRLTQDRAAINRFGFNNDGMEAICTRLRQHDARLPVGLNLGANKDSPDRAQDFATVLSHCGAHVDFVTVNVSSPNTERQRDLQGPAALRALLDGVMTARDGLSCKVFLKIAPDLDDEALTHVARVATESGVDAIIATNTTLRRDGLLSASKDEAGGLSGAPLFERSTRILAKLSTVTDLPLIGVGGISTARDAFDKITAGASAVQLYTGLVYGGISLAARIAQGLDELLQRHGFDTVSQARGTNRDRWT